MFTVNNYSHMINFIDGYNFYANWRKNKKERVYKDKKRKYQRKEVIYYMRYCVAMFIGWYYYFYKNNTIFINYYNNYLI